MIRARVILLAFVALALFAWQDILIWDRTLRGDLQYVGVYHDGWRVMRDALIIVGSLLLVFERHRLEAAFWASAIYLYSLSGMTDLLFFWLDAKPAPVWLEWRCDQWQMCFVPGPLHGAKAVAVNVLALSVELAIFWGLVKWVTDPRASLSSTIKRLRRGASREGVVVSQAGR